jgi:hypothetical protein
MADERGAPKGEGKGLLARLWDRLTGATQQVQAGAGQVVDRAGGAGSRLQQATDEWRSRAEQTTGEMGSRVQQAGGQAPLETGQAPEGASSGEPGDQPPAH